MSSQDTHQDERFDLLIIGAGAAGLTAGIYAGRAGLNTVIVDATGAGGQTGVASTIMNYPGFKLIQGYELAMRFREHAEEYAPIVEGKTIETITPVENMGTMHFRVRTADGDEFLCGGVILATGAGHRKLGVPGEEEFEGKGVSYCATCDGYFFRNKKVYMIGGGNTALMEGLYLRDAGVDVTIVHRRDRFRGDEIYHRQVEERGIPVLWNTVLEEVRGDALVDSVVLKDLKTGTVREMEANGVFIAVGINPNNTLAKDLGCTLDGGGFVVTDRKQRTNIPYIYAAGDLTGGLQQIIVAGAEGALAAMTAHEDLTNPYWVPPKTL